MSIIDALGSHELGETVAEICIVGAGAAGITLANELAAAKREVCLVESGGMTPDEQTQTLYDLASVGYPLRRDYMSRARYFGGSCNLWAGRSMALSRFDMEPRAWVPHSGWPISHSELSAYYPRAGEILRLPDFQRIDRGFLDGAMSISEKMLFDYGPFAPTISLWAKRPMRFGVRYKPAIRRSSNLRLLLNASAVCINLGESGRNVESLTVATLAGRRFEVRARRFILACGGLENARLLLASRHRYANGVGNGHDLVGRFFMDHPRAVHGVVELSEGGSLAMLRGRPLRDGKLQVGVGIAENTQRREGLLNHYATFESHVSGYAEARYQSLVQTMKVLLRRGHAGSRWSVARANMSEIPNLIYLLSPKELLPHSLYRWYALGRRLLPQRHGARKFVVVYFCEQPPDPESRATLGGDVDQLGMQRLVLRWRIGAEVERTIFRLHELLADAMATKGIGRLEAGGDNLTFTDASHHMGTTRMSESPRTGVVDANGKVFGVENLYVAGSSVFPCAGHANPTFTIVALALRLADHLKDKPLQDRIA